MSPLKSRPPQERLRAVGLWLLALGLASALVIYFVVPPDAGGTLDEQTRSKQYLHDLAVYGGKANILQDQFRRWFAGLWQGRALAGTVACLAVLAFLGIRLVAGPRRPGHGAARAGEVEPRKARGQLRLVGTGRGKGGEKNGGA